MTKPRPYGQYFILEKIAQGGMAEIFKGLTYDFSGLKKFIVIKKILPHIAENQDFVRMLVDEAKIAVQLSHGNIAQTYDLGKVGDDYFIVMEYVEGHTLSEILKKISSLHQALPVPVSVHIIRELCQGLDYMHHRRDDAGNLLGIVHCDISPQNLIVSDSGTVKIVDFGVAKVAIRLSEVEPGVIKGKFAYMSPEQAENRSIDSRTDLFSAGIVLWEMLTGRRLFKKKTKLETIQAVQSMVLYPPSAYRHDIPSELDEIVLKALNREVEKRFSSAADMVLALTKFQLKYYPDFKPSEFGNLIKDLFQEEKRQIDFNQEKTQHEVWLDAEKKSSENWEIASGEDTSVIDPQELDFHSLFEEMDLEDLSEVTSSLSLLEGEGGSESEGLGANSKNPKNPSLRVGDKKNNLKLWLLGIVLLTILMFYFYFRRH